jgi:hypothetical protein
MSNPLDPTHPIPDTTGWNEDLARLLPLWPIEISDTSESGLTRRRAAIRRALRAERQRGLQGHWTYDLARHAALLRAYRREQCHVDTRPTQTKEPTHPIE